MQPSVVTSLYRTIPGKQTSNVQALTDVLQNSLYNSTHETYNAPSEDASQISSHSTSQPPSQTESIIEALQPTQGAYLIRPGTITPTSQPPVHTSSPQHGTDIMTYSAKNPGQSTRGSCRRHCVSQRRGEN